MDSGEPWFGGVFRKPGLRGMISLGLSVILILWIALFLGGDIRLRMILGTSVALCAFGFVFFNWGSLLSWSGYKSFVFYVVAGGSEDPAVKDALSLFDDRGVKVSVLELPGEESIAFFQHRRGIYKKDMSAISSSGKMVPAQIVKSYEECNDLLASVKEKNGHVFVVSAVFDASKISQSRAAKMVSKAKEIAFV
jgi:hypothetical protein